LPIRNSLVRCLRHPNGLRKSKADLFIETGHVRAALNRKKLALNKGVNSVLMEGPIEPAWSVEVRHI
jgi:hypothetical protein